MLPVDEARYDSGYSTIVKRHGCTVGTRAKVQEGLQDWVRDLKGTKLYWMNGMAGTGKTTIAYSLCEWLEANQLLGASFFCSRLSSSCRSASSIIPTISYQLARCSPSFRSALCQVLMDDPDLGKLNIARQFERLVLEPISKKKVIIPEGVVVVIDALDECENEHETRLVLGTLLKFGASLPLRFFIASRPEPAIRDNMLSIGTYNPAVLHLHNIEQAIVEEDIKKYLADALGLMLPPPSKEQIELLASRAGKLFIYAATAVRYVLSSKGNTATRLDTILKAGPQVTANVSSNKRYKELDEIYGTILAAALSDEDLEQEEIEAIRSVLWTVVCANDPMAITTLACFVGLTECQAWSALNLLQSVLHVSETSGLVSTLHVSFSDYMFDQRRSGEFSCNQNQHNELLAYRCFKVMSKELRFNICNLSSSFVYDTDISNLEERVKINISLPLYYASQYWSKHLRLASASGILCKELGEFISQRLLFWIEVLNLNQCTVKGIAILTLAEEWLMATDASENILKSVLDARHFITRFAASACCRSTPHIYVSALPFCAKSSSVYLDYWSSMRGLIDVRGTSMEPRDQAAQATWVVTSEVDTLAFSPDGTRIVSGSIDKSIHVLDADNGNIVTRITEGHTGGITSVAFSPNGTSIASGSRDMTIRLWDASGGNAVGHSFEGHSDIVEAIAFSPDGTRIASASRNGVIRVWGTCAGDVVVPPLRGHVGWVNSIVFSPDGSRVVSGSDDRTIRVWDTSTGNLALEPFRGHKGWVTAVVISPDGTRIASGSTDKTIRVWELRTGNNVIEPFQGHVRSVRSVAYSPDGTCIASGSSDTTIRLWDGHTGDLVAGPFRGHANSITSIAFSPDGRRIASGSHDRTIRIWDARLRNTFAGQPEGHRYSVNSVAFSHDGTRIVSGSDDSSIRVWDALTGKPVAEPFQGHMGWVLSVAFSPDSRRIVSGSDDRTIRLWDACTGHLIAGPFHGHLDSINLVAFLPDGTRIVSASYDKTIRLWDVHTGNVIGVPFKGYNGLVSSVSFSPGGRCIVSGFDNTLIKIWDPATGDTVAGPFNESTIRINCLALSHDRTMIAIGLQDGSIRVVNVHTGDTVAGPYYSHTDRITSVSFSPDNNALVSSSRNRAIRVWNLRCAGAGCRYTTRSPPAKSVMLTSNRPCASPEPVMRRVQMVNVLDKYDKFPPCSTTVHSPSVRTLSLNPSHTSDLDKCQDSERVPDPEPPAATHSQREISSHNWRDFAEFECNRHGWATVGCVPIFWAPPDLRAHIPHPHDSLVIGPQGTMFIDYQGLLLGERWAECYVPR